MKILIADDHNLFRAGLMQLLRQLADGIEIIEAANGAEALYQIQENTDIELAIFDLKLPDQDGITLLTESQAINPTLPVIILSASDEVTDMQRAIQAGALGYIPKSERGEVILSAIRLVMAGGLYIPKALANPLPIARSVEGDAGKLTARQLDVLRLLVKGASNKQIAYDLNLTEATVKSHVSTLFKTLAVQNRTQAALVAEKLGLSD